MKRAAILFFFILLTALSAEAGELREIELHDGSVIIGDVVSLEKGIYTIQSPVLGRVLVEEKKVRTIRSQSQSSGPLTGQRDADSLKNRMLSNAEVMDLIEELQNDPDFQRALADPSIRDAVQAGNVAALLSNETFMKLLQNPAVQEIKGKLGE